jgi:hypothetical protein
VLLLVSVGVAYNQCSQKPCDKTSCPSPCPGNCPTPTAASASCPSASAACPLKSECVNCDGDTCALKDCNKVATVAGTVRYVRSTNTAVKVVAGDQSLLLRTNPSCPKASALQAKLAALAKGDAVTAKYWTCPKSGRYYLVEITGGATAAESAATTPAACPSAGGCGGCAAQ